VNYHVLTKFQQNWSKEEAIYYVLNPTNLLILFGIRKNYHSNGRNLLLYQFIRRVIKQILLSAGKNS